MRRIPKPARLLAAAGAVLVPLGLQSRLIYTHRTDTCPLIGAEIRQA